MFLFDAHVHTRESSKCGRASAAEMVETYVEKGYSGIIITDHFLNANTSADRTAPWEVQVATQLAGYQAAKKRGDELGLNVFFAWEAGWGGCDLLTYGLDGEWLLAHQECVKLPVKEYIAYMKAEGAFIVHAHPYRRAHYIEMIRLLPDDVDAVEVINHMRPELDNRLATFYAEAYGLPMTAGSDCHLKEMIPDRVICTERPITSVADYIERIKQGTLILPPQQRK